ncbi:hypothetical protein BMT54_00490 [Pasteurellaceae bacterium 15-036681]|nr:hypothetical protein BMT54_00490 [Pasteurellaceae bacterium 15-036681]
MKKLALVTLTAALSTSVFAAPVGETFTGVGVGMDLTTVKYKSAGLEGKQATGANVIVDYGMDYGNNLVGIVEGKVKVGSTKIFNDVKQKSQFGVAYEQGYRVLPDLLPYAKIDYSVSKVGDVGSFKGFGYGLGTKYAVSNDIEVGVQYMRSNLKHSGTKLKGNAYSATAAYRF